MARVLAVLLRLIYSSAVGVPLCTVTFTAIVEYAMRLGVDEAIGALEVPQLSRTLY